MTLDPQKGVFDPLGLCQKPFFQERLVPAQKSPTVEPVDVKSPETMLRKFTLGGFAAIQAFFVRPEMAHAIEFVHFEEGKTNLN